MANEESFEYIRRWYIGVDIVTLNFYKLNNRSAATRMAILLFEIQKPAKCL